ncbi:hypothetical protein [Oerskovia turbata]
MRHTLFGDHRHPTTELDEIFGAPGATTGAALDEAATWARGVLEDARVDPARQVGAIAALRAAEPRLGLKSATFLAGLLVE